MLDSGSSGLEGAADDVLVRVVELRERVILRVLDRGDDEGAVAVLALEVDGQPEVDGGRRDDVGLAVHFGEVALSRWLDDQMAEEEANYYIRNRVPPFDQMGDA